MSNVTSSIARAVRRTLGPSWIALAISLVIVAVAAATLFRVFRDIELGRVVAALKAQSLRGLFLSGGFVGAGYLVLTCYDVFALRAIGRTNVPYRVAALASFTSCTIGHSFGAAIFTSGFIRYRIYSAWGLNIGEIARIAFFTGLTYWLGNAFVLGCGIALAPAAVSAVNHLPAPINRLIGLATLVAINGYMLWLWAGPRTIGRAHWRIVLPDTASTLVQIGIGSLDLTVVSLAMYAVLPSQPVMGFFSLMVIFVTAMLIGVVSYVPGSLGVMEAAMFIGLPQFRTEDLLASLVSFRVLYFVIPLLLAALLLGWREVRSVAAAMGPGSINVRK